jgi:hypothetical protein
MAQLVPAVRVAFRDQDGDLGRQWVVAQYVLHGINPYPVARAALLAQYGVLAPRGPVHLRDARIFRIPRTGTHPQTDSTLGPPETTYPPGDVMLLVPAGLLSRDVVRVLWLLFNISLVFLVARELRILACAEDISLLFFIALVAAWPAVAACIEREQLSLLSLFCILAAQRIQTTRPLVAGLLLSISLLKPSLALPFLAVPFSDRRATSRAKVKALAAVAASQLALLGAICCKVHAGPLELTRGWLAVAAYFRQGMYTAQDLINGLRLDGSAADTALEGGILLAGIVAAHRLRSPGNLAFLSVISCIWTYHAQYDFVTLLIPAALLSGQPFTRREIIFMVELAMVGVGCTAPVYEGTGETRFIRYVVRISLAALATGLVSGPFSSREVSTGSRPSSAHRDPLWQRGRFSGTSVSN